MIKQNWNVYSRSHQMKAQAFFMFVLTTCLLPQSTTSFATTKTATRITSSNSITYCKSLGSGGSGGSGGSARNQQSISRCVQNRSCYSVSTTTTIRNNYDIIRERRVKNNSSPLSRLQATSDIAASEYFDSNNDGEPSSSSVSTATNQNNSKSKSSSIKSSNINSTTTATSTTTSTTNKPDLKGIASYSKLIVFISTTIIIWLSEPLLSLVDTTVVGKFASSSSSSMLQNNGISLTTLQLAALGPATMVIDNAFYLIYFLAIAVTNQLASTSSNDPNSSSIKMKTTSHALGVASILGSLITFVIFAFGDGILRFIIGEGGAMINGIDMTSSLISSSWDYTKIRGLLAPLTVMGMIAQAVCLATLDTRTPALAVIVASIINVFGDILLVAKFKMGLRGAAIATAAAGMGSSFLLLHRTKKKVHSWTENAMQKMKSSMTKEEKVGLKLPPFISLPDPKAFVSLVKLAGPIFFVLLGKIICYSSMTLKATDFEMMSLATHNIMLRVFFFFCTFGDGFSLAAQSFLPQVLYNGGNERSPSTDGNHGEIVEQSSNSELKEPSQSDKFRAKQLLKRILLLASGMAVLNSSLTKIILQQGGTFFTNDTTILSLLGSSDRVFYMMGAVFLHPLIMAFEGSILATRDLGFLVSSYGVTMAILLSTLQFGVSTFTGVWKALFLFQAIRFFIFGSRVFMKTRVKAA